MDLMRYGPDAPKNIMDFLFVELLEWGKGQGYEAFEFGMAPLAGLDDRPLATVMSQLGKLIFERGKDFYNFQGVRRYKDKYDPVWRPRYIGAPTRWKIPFLLADIGLMSSGGKGAGQVGQEGRALAASARLSARCWVRARRGCQPEPAIAGPLLLAGPSAGATGPVWDLGAGSMGAPRASRRTRRPRSSIRRGRP